jgi:hypothetical protein
MVEDIRARAHPDTFRSDVGRLLSHPWMGKSVGQFRRNRHLGAAELNPKKTRASKTRINEALTYAWERFFFFGMIPPLTGTELLSILKQTHGPWTERDLAKASACENAGNVRPCACFPDTEGKKDAH